MANNAKSKGKRGESAVCQMLSECFGLPFVRVFGSGAYFGGKNIKNFDKFTKKQQDLNEGDIVVPEEFQNFSIECKNYKEFPFHQLFTDNCQLLDSWINQASHTKKKYWLLFFKITHKNTFICYPKYYELKTTHSFLTYRDKYVIEIAQKVLENNKNEFFKMGNDDWNREL